MTSCRTIGLAVLALGSCTSGGPLETDQPPNAQGTFVGNPSLTARYVDNAIQKARGGRIETVEVLLNDCDSGGVVSLGSPVFGFQGGTSSTEVQVPIGDYCGIFLNIREMIVQFDEGGSNASTLIANDFQLELDESFVPDEGEIYTLQLGDETWLTAVATLAGPGETLIDGTDALLAEAFFGGLDGSTVELTSTPADPPVIDEPLAGRLNLEDYPVSGTGLTGSFSGCVPGSNFDFAVPIPPAAMATAELGTDVGWCEGNITFSDSLDPLTSIQVDYSDLSIYPISYNGWGIGCEALHCNEVYSDLGQPLGRPCTLLAFCDGAGEAVVTGYAW